MPKPRAGADNPHSRRNTKQSDTPSHPIARSPSDRLHVALAVALAAVALVSIAFPLTRSSARASSSDTTPVLVVSEGFAATLQSQARSVAGALVRAGAAPTPQDPALPQGRESLPGVALVPRPLLAAAAEILVQGALAGPDGQQRLAMELQQPTRFTLHEDGVPATVFSTRPTVGAALASLGAEYRIQDIISPPPETPLTAGLHVFVERATMVSMMVGGRQPEIVYTHGRTVAELLAERKLELGKADSVVPALEEPIRPGLAVVVTRVESATEVEETPIPFRTIYRSDPSLTQGIYVERRTGYNGYVRREFTVVYRDGAEIRRELLSEEVVAPTHRIVAQGTAPVYVAPAPQPAPPPAGSGECARSMTVWATWYTAASAGGSGRTATGTTVGKGTVAVDPRVIPLGTEMYIPGYGYGRAEDTGGAIVGHVIDLGYGPDDVKDWRTGYVKICILP